MRYGLGGRYEGGRWIKAPTGARIDYCEGCGNLILHDQSEPLRYCPSQRINGMELPGCEPPAPAVEDIWYGPEGSKKREQVERAREASSKEAEDRQRARRGTEPTEQEKAHAKELVAANERRTKRTH